MFFHLSPLACLIAASAAEVAEVAVGGARISPQYRQAFQFTLPVPSIKQPLTSYTNPKNGVPIDFFEVEAKSFKRKFYPDLPGFSDLVGYDGMFPGPTLRVEKGREALVRVINRASDQMNVHLHGSYSRSPFDGHATDLISPGQYKDYYYPNNVQRTLWYHDHASGKNAINAYRGLVGVYQIVDSKLDASLGIPSGEKYDIPLVLSSHYFTRSGALSNETGQVTSIYGDTYLVNGQIQPYLAVEPRKYRFRILNAAVSRVFNLTLVDGTASISMSVIGSDGGFRQSPINTNALVIGMADRWEVIVDFVALAGKNVTLITKNMWTDQEYSGADQIMRFVVGKSVGDDTANAPLARQFNLDLKFPSEVKVAAERTFRLDSHMDQVWGINGYHMDDPMSRILMRPPLGTVEKYTFKSYGMGMNMVGRSGSADPSLKVASNSSDGVSMSYAAWTHSMHMHLVDMRLISRRKDNASKAEGRGYLEEYEKDSIKDVVLLGSNEVVEVLAKFQPYPGVYMFHCHNSVHSDKGMMGLFNVTRLADLGYEDLVIGLEDPLDPRFRAKPYTGTNLEEIKSKTLPYFAGLNAYPDPAKLSEIEDRYWSTRTPPSGKDTGAVVSGGMMGGMSGMMGSSSVGSGSSNSPTASSVSSGSSSSSSSSMGGMMGGSGTNHEGMGGMMGSSSGSSGGGMSGMMSGGTMRGGTTAGTCSTHDSHHGGCKSTASHMNMRRNFLPRGKGNRG